MPKGIKGFVKGICTNPTGRPMGALGKITLEREAKRKFLEEKSAEQWESLIDTLHKKAKQDIRALQYTIDQNIGKPTETKKVEVTQFDFED